MAIAQDQVSYRTLIIKPAGIQNVDAAPPPKRSVRDNTRFTGGEHPTRFAVVSTGGKG